MKMYHVYDCKKLILELSTSDPMEAMEKYVSIGASASLQTEVL